MKKRALVISTMIALIGFTVIGISSKPQPSIDCENKEESSLTNYFDVEIVESEMASENLDLFYSVGRKYEKTVTKEELKSAKLISDIIRNYPFNWIKDYVSVEIRTRNNGEESKATGANEKLTEEQIRILNAANNTADIDISVKYKAKNAVTDRFETRQMNVSLGIIPEVEAEFIGGYEQMINFLKENSLEEITAKSPEQISLSTVSFIVNEKGKTESVKLTQTSGNNEIDELLVNLIKKMPKWKPAENNNGSLVKQKFAFNIGMDGC